MGWLPWPPADIGAVVAEIDRRIEEAREKAEQSAQWLNSYGHGYDVGQADALRDLRAALTGEDDGQ